MFVSRCLVWICASETERVSTHLLLKILKKRLPSPENIQKELVHLRAAGALSMPVSEVAQKLIALFELERRFAKRVLWLGRLNECVSAMVQFDDKKDSVQKYLSYLSYLEENEFYDPHFNGVTLMTMHAAKGLEFPVVCICGCEEGSIPSLVAGSDCEEERRLLYVAITRAQHTMYLMCAQTRNGKRRTPSSFIGEIPSTCLPQQIDKASIRKKTRKSQLTLL